MAEDSGKQLSHNGPVVTPRRSKALCPPLDPLPTSPRRRGAPRPAWGLPSHLGSLRLSGPSLVSEGPSHACPCPVHFSGC